MNINKLVFKNIRRRLSDYAMYLASSGFIVAVFYIFASIYYNEQFVFMQQHSGSYQTGFRVAAILVLIYGAAFIWYSSSFFVRSRKKETATYLLMGLSKGQVSRMLFLEIMTIGLIGVCLGLGAGVLFSKYVGMLFVKITKQIADIHFALVPKALGISVLVFVVLYLVNALHISSLVYRVKLIDMYQADKKAERWPKGSWVIGILGLGLLIYGYVDSYLMRIPFNVQGLLRVTLVVAAGTFLLMGSLLTLILRLASKNKKSYWGGPRLIAISQLMYRIRGQAVSLAAIAVLSAMALTAVSAVWSIYSTSEEEARYYQPFDIAYVSDAAEAGQVDAAVDTVLADYGEIPTYDTVLALPRVTVSGAGRAYAVSESRFNEIVKVQHSGTEVSLEPGQAVYTDQVYYTNSMDSRTPRYDEVTISAGDASYTFAVLDNRKDKITPINVNPLFVVSDTDYDSIAASAGNNTLYLRGMMINDPLGAELMIQELDNIVPGPEYRDYTQPEGEAERDREFEAYAFKYEDLFMSTGIFLFVELFTGLLFLMALGSILYYKQLNESRFDAPRYRILQRVGMDKSEIRRSVGIQLGIVFAIPLVISIVHSIFAIRILTMIFANIWGAFFFVVAVYSALFGLYYLVTWRQYVARVTS